MPEITDIIRTQEDLDNEAVTYTVEVLKRQVAEAIRNGQHSVKAVMFGVWTDSTHALFVSTVNALGYTVSRDPIALTLYNVSW